MPPTDRDCLAWNALRRTRGIGPKRLAPLAIRLAEQRRGAGELIGAPAAELTNLGLSASLAERAVSLLADPPGSEPAPPGSRVVCVDDEDFPRDRMSVGLPLPAILYCSGNLGLLKAGGLAVSGSRSPHPAALDFTTKVAELAAREGVNVVSGHAAGVDETAHLAAVRCGGTTTVVAAEGLGRFALRPSLRNASEDSLLIVSEFDPTAGWTPGHAMQRNTTIAALSDAVVVAAANHTGGARAQGELCIRAGKTLLVADLPADVAPGNPELIEMGGIPVDPEKVEAVLDHLRGVSVGDRQGEQLDLLP